MLIKTYKMYPDAQLPFRTSDGAVGFDICAYHVLDRMTKEVVAELPATIPVQERMLFGAGIQFAVPPGIDAQLRPRSGLANKYGVQLLNSPGTIDPDFRGEAGILLLNLGSEPFTVRKGDRIAQLLFTRVELPEFVEVDTLPYTVRNTGGFGSTGIQGPGFGLEQTIAWRLKEDRYLLSVAQVAAGKSNCLRGAKRGEDGHYLVDANGYYVGATRRFGCVIARDENIISVGYNMRTPECSEECGCVRENENIDSGKDNDRGCFHAEEVALQKHAFTGGPALAGATMVTNAEPCLKCSKYMLGCGISAIVVPPDVYHANGLDLLLNEGIEVRRVKL